MSPFNPLPFAPHVIQLKKLNHSINKFLKFAGTLLVCAILKRSDSWRWFATGINCQFFRFEGLPDEVRYAFWQILRFSPACTYLLRVNPRDRTRGA